MTALAASGHLAENGFPLNDFRRADFTSPPQPFDREPNAWFDRDSPRLI
jgi:hypothetical protein